MERYVSGDKCFVITISHIQFIFFQVIKRYLICFVIIV